MGAGITEVCARAGSDVVVFEIDPMAAEAGRARVEKSLDRGLAAGKITEEERARAAGAIRYTTTMEELADRQLVVEAVIEREADKLDVFGRLDKVVTDPAAILASNTSSIPIMKLAMATARPDRVVGLHFFNPVPVLKLVELVPSLLTSDETVSRVTGFANDVLHKTVIRSQDRAGFVVNSLLVPYLLSAVRMVESGFASAADIDAGMMLGCAHPMGPLRLADLIGLDTIAAIASAMYEEFKEPMFAAPPSLSRMVEAGLLGRKSGRGFYSYEPVSR
jgi:3-hydroxybutyryl-CoA dehydrogenase